MIRRKLCKVFAFLNRFFVNFFRVFRYGLEHAVDAHENLPFSLTIFCVRVRRHLGKLIGLEGLHPASSICTASLGLHRHLITSCLSHLALDRVASCLLGTMGCSCRGATHGGVTNTAGGISASFLFLIELVQKAAFVAVASPKPVEVSLCVLARKLVHGCLVACFLTNLSFVVSQCRACSILQLLLRALQHQALVLLSCQGCFLFAAAAMLCGLGLQHLVAECCQSDVPAHCCCTTG
mmetsp:Transcript_67311/g.132775  ORF Transcript_67311/g.132775 Transcript_67311/m.132775 type:complete len:237 (-) Transcript_67311:420-1130(-)